jgi:Ca-activated chloride channel family protein
MANELTLTTSWGRENLAAGGDGQLAYLLIDLAADPQAAVTSTPLPLNLALVLDHSGSMSGPKLQHLKEAVQRVIDQLGPNDTLSVTVFDEKAKLLVPTQKVSDKAALQAQVAALREAGGTQMSSGLRMGIDEVRRATGPDVVSRILLLTDGQTWGDAEQCDTLAAEAGRVSVPISAFGVGAEEDWSVGLLDRIAQASGGQSDYIAQPADMLNSFRKTVQTMQETVVQRAALTVQLSAGVNARAVYRITPMISRINPQIEGDRAVTVPLGDVGRDAPVTVLFELTVPPRRPGQYRLARTVVRYEVPGTPDPSRQLASDILASFVAGDSGAPNPRVMNIVEKATAFRLQTRALEEAEVGNVTAASRNLRSAATRLLNLGETDLAQSAEQEAERLERKGQMSPGGTKKLTFATRKLAIDDVPPPGAAPASESSAPPPAVSVPPAPPEAPAAPVESMPAVASAAEPESTAAPTDGSAAADVPTQRINPATPAPMSSASAPGEAGAVTSAPADLPSGSGGTSDAGGSMRD